MSVNHLTRPDDRIRVERGIWKRTTKSGEVRFEVVVSQHGSVTRETVDGGLKQARARRGEILARRYKGERIMRPSKVTFGDVIDEWREQRAPRLAPRTLKLYEHHLKRVESWWSRPVASLNVDDAAKLVIRLEREGLSANTIRQVRVAISAPLRLAVRRGHIAQNPIRALDREEIPTIERKPKRLLDGEETAKILNAANDRWRLIIAFALATGVRQGEQLGLKWSDLDLNAGVVHVRRQLDRDGALSPLKTAAASRDIPLASSLVRKLKEHRLASGHSLDHDFVFATRDGKPLAHRNVVRQLDALVKRTKLAQPKVHWHSLRDTYIANLFRSGADPYFVAEKAGHTRASFTLDVYGGVLQREEQSEVAAAALEAAVGRLI